MQVDIKVLMIDGTRVTTTVPKEDLIPIDQYDFEGSLTLNRDNKGRSIKVNLKHALTVEHVELTDE